MDTRWWGNLVPVQTMLMVADLGRSVSFYAGALGFGVLWRHEHIELLESGPMLLYLATQGPSTPDVSLEPPDRPRRLPSSRCATAPQRTRSLSSVGWSSSPRRTSGPALLRALPRRLPGRGGAAARGLTVLDHPWGLVLYLLLSLGRNRPRRSCDFLGIVHARKLSPGLVFRFVALGIYAC